MSSSCAAIQRQPTEAILRASIEKIYIFQMRAENLK